MKKIRPVIYVVAIVVLVMGASSPAMALTFSDDFNDNSLNTFWWTPWTSGNSISETNSRMEMTQGSSGYGYLTLNYSIIGDFYAQVDYQLLGTWASDNKERLALIGEPGAQPGAVERINDSSYGGQIYLTNFIDGVQGSTSTSDTNGKLKIERIGSTLSGYYWNGSGWSLIHSYGSADTSNAAIKLQMWPLDMVSSPAGIQAAFDNFYLDAPSTPNPVVPEPATMTLLGLGTLALAIRKRSQRTRV